MDIFFGNIDLRKKMFQGHLKITLFIRWRYTALISPIKMNLGPIYSGTIFRCQYIKNKFWRTTSGECHVKCSMILYQGGKIACKLYCYLVFIGIYFCFHFLITVFTILNISRSRGRPHQSSPIVSNLISFHAKTPIKRNIYLTYYFSLITVECILLSPPENY